MFNKSIPLKCQTLITISRHPKNTSQEQSPKSFLKTGLQVSLGKTHVEEALTSKTAGIDRSCYYSSRTIVVVLTFSLTCFMINPLSNNFAVPQRLSKNLSRLI